MCRAPYILYFKISAPIFCCPILSENYLNPQVKINKMVNKPTVDYHPSPSQLTSRINPLMFLWIPKGFVYLSGIYLEFFPKPVYSTAVAEVSPLLLPSQKETTHSSWTPFPEDLFFPSRKGGGGRIMELKKVPKLNLQGYWSQILINSTIFATFTFLVSVLLCHNLASHMLKCEGSLT